jgi:hypothetical protein
MASPLVNRTAALANTMARQATLLAAAQRAADEIAKVCTEVC